MSFIMPKIDLNSIPFILRSSVIERIVDQEDYLVEIPNSQLNDLVKYWHHIILKVLYPNNQWKTPLPGAWCMPHISRVSDFDYLEESITKYVHEMITNGVFK